MMFPHVDYRNTLWFSFLVIGGDGLVGFREQHASVVAMFTASEYSTMEMLKLEKATATPVEAIMLAVENAKTNDNYMS